MLKLLSEYKDKVCDHFHLPLQSGSDKILKLMGRQYTCLEYQKTYYEAIRKYFPKAHLSADVIPGFPGEEEKEFLETVEFIKLCKLGKPSCLSLFEKA